jgi:phage terminase small subunit
MDTKLFRMGIPVSNKPFFMMPVEPNMGPAMLALTENQRAFVVAMLETGAVDASRAATIAGFGNTEGSRWQAGWRLSHNPKVLAAIREEADKRLRSGAILGASVLVEIAGNTLHKDRFKAAVELLNRAGLIVTTEHKVIVEDDRRDRAMVEQAVVALAKRLNIDPALLLGVRASVIDGQFEEVPAMSSEGIEDLL